MGGDGTATMHKCPVPGSHTTIAYPGTDLTTKRLVLIQGGFGSLCKIMRNSFHFIPFHLQQLVKWASLGFTGRVSCMSCSYVIVTCFSLSIMITDFILSYPVVVSTLRTDLFQLPMMLQYSIKVF